MTGVPPGLTMLLVAGAAGQASGRYRVDHKKEMNALLGIETLAVEFRDLRGVDSMLERAELVVIHRAAHHEALERLILRAHNRGRVVAFDIDDLIFDPDDLKYIRAREHWPPTMVKIFDDGIPRFRRTLELCDIAITSTDFLAARIEDDFGIKSFVLRYNLSREQVELSLDAARQVCRDSQKVRIGYFAGSEVHDFNFLVAADALLCLLERRREVELLVGGYLTLDDRFARVGDRVARAPFVPWQKLPYVMATCDAVIAPLDNNPHNRSKAETKYIESAVLGVPLVASPLDSFRLCIRDGDNGYLARDSEEWLAKLEKLVDGPATRAEMGRRAKEHALRQYTSEARAKEYAEVVGRMVRMATGRSRRYPVDVVRPFCKRYCRRSWWKSIWALMREALQPATWRKSVYVVRLEGWRGFLRKLSRASVARLG